MAKFSNMSLPEASAKAMGDRFDAQRRRITTETYEYYKSIKAWEYPHGTYERDSWISFLHDPNFREYVLGITIHDILS